MLTRVALYSNL